MARKTGSPREDAFIEAYWENGGRTDVTAKKLGIPVQTVYSWFKRPDFREKVQERQAVWAEALRARALQRALDKSDTLLIFLLKSIAPETYDDNFRRTKWLTERGYSDPDAPVPVRAILIRGDEPERVRDATSTGPSVANAPYPSWTA
jgi:hypothetical protein